MKELGGAQMEDAIRYVSNSELQTFKDCRRRWYLGYFRGLLPNYATRTGPLTMGTRVHFGLEKLETADSNGDALVEYDRLVEDDRAKLSEWDDTVTFEKEVTLGRVMLEGYINWLEETGEDATIEPYGVEQALSAPLSLKDSAGREIYLLGKLDRRVTRKHDGAILFMDHKTAMSFARVFKTLSLNEQFLTYQLLERLHLIETGEERTPTQGAYINVLRKVGRGKTAKPPFYAREEVHHNTTELRNFWHRVREEVSDMMILEARLLADPTNANTIAYPHPTVDCSWKCPFFHGCGMFDDGSDAEGWLAGEFHVGDPLLRYRDHNRHPDVDAEYVGDVKEGN